MIAVLSLLFAACGGSSEQGTPDAQVPSDVRCGTPCDAGACATGVFDCSGGEPACIAETLSSAGTVCRESAGDCDVEEQCDGTSPTCPVDLFAQMGTSCRPAEGACDAEETCDGSSPSCPDNAAAADGTPCDQQCISAQCTTGQCQLDSAAADCGAVNLIFDGSDDIATLNANLTLGENYSFEVWFFVGTVGQLVGNQYLVTVENGPSFHAYGIAEQMGMIRAISATNGSSAATNTFVANGFGRWVHFAAVGDGALLRLYADGALLGVIGAYPTLNANSLTLAGTNGASSPFAGRLANARLWSRSLSAEEVSSFAGGQDPTSDAVGLVAWWPLAEGGGQTLQDLVSGVDAGFLGANNNVETSDPSWGSD